MHKFYADADFSGNWMKNYAGTTKNLHNFILKQLIIYFIREDLFHLLKSKE